MDKRRWVVYLIQCSDESLYCGITNNLKNRLIAHNSGRGGKYTRSRRPVELVAASSKMTKSDALKLEYRIKQIPASKKNLELTKEENKMTKNLKKDLQAVIKELKALAKKTESLLKAVDKLEKPKAVKKTSVKKVAVKKAAAKKPVLKKAATAVDTVLAIINRYKKGVGTAALMEKTGYNQKKIANLVFKLRKQGKIKSVVKGVYLKA
jgi:putative endonuclease